jgi:hypothetical protein
MNPGGRNPLRRAFCVALLDDDYCPRKTGGKEEISDGAAGVLIALRIPEGIARHDRSWIWRD